MLTSVYHESVTYLQVSSNKVGQTYLQCFVAWDVVREAGRGVESDADKGGRRCTRDNAVEGTHLPGQKESARSRKGFRQSCTNILIKASLFHP